MDSRLVAFERLLNIMDDLREKCPWDKKQTIQTLRKLTIEETYELSDAIIQEDWESIKEELGDIMLHLVFYGKIATEQGQFDVAEMLNTVCEKLISRHPHIYGDVHVADEEEVKRNWEQLKLKEGKTSVLQGVPKGLPSMVKSQRIQDKARQVGFDWDTAEQVMDKVKEELQELERAALSGDKGHVEEELGDVLFAIINYARFQDIDAEKALELSNLKFIRRFQWMENYAREHQKNMQEQTLETLESWWLMSKKVVG
jgi:XTP/dITP diphosphohydrolase